MPVFEEFIRGIKSGYTSYPDRKLVAKKGWVILESLTSENGKKTNSLMSKLESKLRCFPIKSIPDTG